MLKENSYPPVLGVQKDVGPMANRQKMFLDPPKKEPMLTESEFAISERELK